MTEAGKLTIAGEVETTQIDQGFTRIKSGFKQVENQANQTNASMSRAGQITGKLATNLKVIALAGAAAMTALATKSPVMANTMAKIDVSLLKLSNTVGRHLQPVFEGFNSLIGNFNSFLSGGSGGNPDSIFKGAIAGGGVGAIAGGIIGFMIGGPAGIVPGAWIGGTVGTAVGAVAGKEISEYKQNYIDPITESMKNTEDALAGGDFSKGQVTALKIGYAQQDIGDAIAGFFETMFSLFTGKDRMMSMATGVAR